MTFQVSKAKNGKRIMYFQTKEGTDLSERNQVIDFMQKNNYHKDTTFMNGCKEDAMIPDGWKYKKVKQSTGRKIFMFLPPKSINFMVKQTVLEYMIYEEEQH